MRYIMVAALVLALNSPLSLAQSSDRTLSCLGRIEPSGGVVRLYGPTALGAVIMDRPTTPRERPSPMPSRLLSTRVDFYQSVEELAALVERLNAYALV